jgi:hypothetical protein
MPHLYPYYYRVKQANPDCDVYLVEDNLGAHTRAREFIVDEDLLGGINFAPHPGNSPNLHPIKRVFDTFEDALQDHKLSGASIEAKEAAMDAIGWHWIHAESFGQRMEDMTDPAEFVKKARLCLRDNGENSFHG